ncbi:uncharacterized protein [Drosophila suzukii]|uniref:Uncharacterized protein n=1 Tax=Drosophila suzukii TaxID=28584 RepID=A0AB39Z058_DROSZ
MTTDISKLNQYCLYSIFEQIKNNCEQDERRLPDIIRYRDLICFAVTNDYLNSQFKCWNKSLYMRLEVEKIHSWTCQIIYINFYELHVSQKKCTSAERKVFWDIFLISIDGNTRLTHCLLSFFPKTDYCPDHVEMFEKTMRVLAKKKLLKSLTLRMLGYTAGNLENFQNLRSLSLYVPMEADDLTECVKSNPNLIELAFTSTDMHGRLADITPYCRNLETLEIQMKPETDASKYAPLAKLPKLKTFIIFGSPEEGSLRALFKSMVMNSLTDLQALSIQQAKLGSEEVEELSKVGHLQRLRCELKPTRSSEGPSSFKLPKLFVLDLETVTTKDIRLDYNSIDILTSRGNIGIAIKQGLDRSIILRLNDWQCKKELSPMLVEKQKLIQTLSQIKKISTTERVAKIAAISLLEAFQSQFPAVVRNIHLLTKIRGLKELEVKVWLNIEDQLMQFMDPNEVDDCESVIVIDSDTQILILLVQLTYLKDILENSKFSNIKNCKHIKNYTLELDIDIRL